MLVLPEGYSQLPLADSKTEAQRGPRKQYGTVMEVAPRADGHYQSLSSSCHWAPE